MQDTHQPKGFTGTQRWVLGLAAAGSFMAALDAMVVTTALDTLRHDLAASVEALEWTVNAYTFSFAALLMTGAALGDRFGRRRMYVVGLALFALASAACALAPSTGWLIAGRAVQGLGAALLMPIAMALLGAAFPPPQRAKALGLFSGITGLAVLSGPLIGGAIVHGLAWQWIFWINLPVALAVGWLVLAKVPEGKAASAPLDIWGALLMTASLLGLVWGLVRGNRDGWDSTEVLISLAAGVVLGALFVASQRLRAWDAMVPPRLFRSPVLAVGLSITFLLTASLMGTLFFMAQFFQVAWHLSPLAAGASMLPWTATLFLVAPVAGAMVKRVGEKALVVAGLVLQALGMVWLAALVSSGRGDAGYWMWVLPLALAGGGISMAMPAVQSAVLGAVEPADMGKAAGLFNTLRQLGGVFGVALVVAVFTRVGGYASPQQFGAGFTATLMATAALSLAGAAVGWRLKPRAAQDDTAAIQGVKS
ncbi:MFS transporter [Polaromonas sp. A23]|uniref:MFS transporter n=1 Tax=Polaromonas sp. A23 TaxID=1944133 RepID=UPI000984B93F|nr:MFS transporter [Polaromonas sp. A23]OOG39813.1 MFS transporter [Polaromonas sp. A23]